MSSKRSLVYMTVVKNEKKADDKPNEEGIGKRVPFYKPICRVVKLKTIKRDERANDV